MNHKGIKDKTFVCLNCKIEFPFKGYSFNHKYCTLKCSHEHQHKKRRERDYQLFLEGKLKSRPFIKEFIIERDGYQCSLCNIDSWRGKPITLWIDHIDGDATNNNPSNFRLLCPNCDSQQATFGAKNTGKGRKSRGLPQYG